LEQTQDQLLEHLKSIKDPEQLEKAVQTENVEKFIDRSKQANN
jgi:DNA recombination protein RmuC